MNKYPITLDGFNNIKNKLHELKTKTRPQIINAIKIAREHGDLSENAEYHAAKDKQGFIEAKIRNLETKIIHAQVIDISKLSGNKILFGATITAYDFHKNANYTWQLVGEEEIDIKQKKFSINSPIAQAFIGKKIGDFIYVNTPIGEKKFQIKHIEFK